MGRRFFQEGDGDTADLAGQQVAIVGYGHLGRPAARNLRADGLDVVVGTDRAGARALAQEDGFAAVSMAEAISSSDVVWLTLPDEVVPEVLGSTAPKTGAMLCFPSGYCLAFDLVTPPAGVDVVMLAPRMVGTRIEARVAVGESFYSYCSVERDATGRARSRLLALAKAFGTLRRGAMELSAAEEAAVDLFVEQTVGPYLGASVLAAFEVATGRGLPPEAMVLELYQSGEMAATWEAFASEGFYGGVRLHGHAASFGGFLRIGDIDMDGLKRRFEAILDDIETGSFARRFQEELAAGSPTRALIEAMVKGDDPLTAAEKVVRAEDRSLVGGSD